ncbi:hypothetical protein [Pseudoalteromonas sp. S4741]|uniref:hypothetical protein n=1 Tax=Pseudoalteromonas sp. S4741 TaxID=579563 RepID=UPI00110A53D9|nr:hypothetical protein [Pseudoalteromonas sp. S4741]TMO20670.1 hypothetical protein CWC30_17605 [Pseudoalteromonas sp. S4741]
MSELENNSEELSGRKGYNLESLSVKNMFILTLLIGAVGIIAGILLTSTLVSILIPIVIMAIYIYITLSKDTDLPITIIGDSYYYQGFIFTLVALMGSLFSLGVKEQVNMHAMVASFGSALVTTIIGLVARLYVTSFSLVAQKRRERLEYQIEKSLDRFTGQIDTLTLQVVSSINKVHGQTESTLSETLKKYSDVNSKVLNDYNETMQSNAKLISESLENVSHKISSIEISPDLISSPLQQALKEIINSMHDYESKFIEVNVNFKALADKLVNQYGRSEETLQSHVTNLESKLSETIKTHTKKYNDNLNNISEGIISSLSDITDLKITTEEAVEARLENFTKGIDTVVEKINSSIEPVASASQSLSQVGEQVTDSLVKISNKTSDLTESINKSIESFDNVESVNTDLSKLLRTIKDFNSSLEKATSINDKASNKIYSAAQSTEDASGQLANDIAEVYKQLTLQIRALRSSQS